MKVAELALVLGISWGAGRKLPVCTVPFGEASQAREGRGDRCLQKGSVTPLEHRYCFEQCLLRYLAHSGLLGGWANEQGNQMIPPWAGLPQAHLQLGHVIPLSTSLALVLVSPTTLWVTFDLGKEPLPCAQRMQAEGKKLGGRGAHAG